MAVARIEFSVTTNALIEKIDAILPQTQCTQCGYAGCKPYAVAIVQGKADINQCPPGGKVGIKRLAALLGIQPKPLNAQHGISKSKSVAIIDESICIGCTLCIHACPVDAIVGATKQMHTVVASECTGCELCIAPCPVDCISMLSINAKNADKAHEYRRSGSLKPNPITLEYHRFAKHHHQGQEKQRRSADQARERFQFRQFRIEREESEKLEKLAAKHAAAKAILASGTKAGR